MVLPLLTVQDTTQKRKTLAEAAIYLNEQSCYKSFTQELIHNYCLLASAFTPLLTAKIEIGT